MCSSDGLTGFAALWAMVEVFSASALRVQLHDQIDAKALLRGEWRPDRPVRVAQSEGHSIRDYVGATTVAVNLLSPKVLSALRQVEATGWSSCPIEPVGEGLTPLKGHEILVVSGRCGPIDPYLSELCWREAAAPGGRTVRALRGLLFDPRSWDGSDVFCPRGSLFVMMTSKAKSAIEATAATGLRFDCLATQERLLAGSGRYE